VGFAKIIQLFSRFHLGFPRVFERFVSKVISMLSQCFSKVIFGVFQDI
jgi:hypothetical protein